MNRWVLLGVFVAGAAVAAEESRKLRVASVSEFAESRALIEQAVRESDQYRDLQEHDRRKLFEALDDMQATLAGVTSVDQLDERSKTQLFNDQELINNVLTQARDDSRMICKREKKVGTHRVTNICITAGERRRQRDRNAEANERFHRAQRGGDSLFCNVGGWC
jgi:hypothetical protein